jgi:predicted ATP-dependent endonuclease of OLD family
LLIDEIEVGLHRATLDIMWPFLFTLAHRFNVQLFATTHSWDCITSFAAAAKATPEDDGALIRLERKGSDIVAVSYDEATLAVAAEQGIEVR